MIHRAPDARLAPLRSLARDGLVRLACLLLTLSLASAVLLPADSPASLTATWIPLAFVALVVASFRRGLRNLAQTAERSFWNDLAIAFACWMAVLLLRLVPVAPENARSLLLLEDGLWAMHYMVFLLALERRPHRRCDWRPAGLERALAWPGAAVFILGLLAYFVLIPAATNPPVYDSNLPSFYLFTSLDLYLAAVLVYLAAVTAVDRWRMIYSLLAVAMALFLVTDFLEALEYTSGWTPPTYLIPLWNLPFVCMVLAARARHWSFSGRTGWGTRLGPVEGSPSGPALRTVSAALAVPLLHFTCSAFGLLDGASEALRERLVFWWMGAMGILALLQHRALEHKVRAIWRERGHFEASVQDSRDDLRVLVERRHAEAEVRQSELQFAEAFQASDDALAITSAGTGRLLEINERFEQIYGYHRDRSVGNTVDELGLWVRPEERYAIVAELRRTKAVRDREIDLRHASGELRRVLFSAVLIDFEGESCLLSATHDPRERDAADLTQPSALLERADDALCILDAEGRLTYWNPACEALYGWRAAETLGRPFIALVGHDLDAHRAAWDAAGETGEWTGELRQIDRKGRELQVGSRWMVIRDPSGSRCGQLVLCFERERVGDPAIQGVSLPPTCATDPPISSPPSALS